MLLVPHAVQPGLQLHLSLWPETAAKPRCCFLEELPAWVEVLQQLRLIWSYRGRGDRSSLGGLHVTLPPSSDTTSINSGPRKALEIQSHSAVTRHLAQPASFPRHWQISSPALQSTFTWKSRLASIYIYKFFYFFFAPVSRILIGRWFCRFLLSAAQRAS